jgi:hypothetical protein
LKTITKDKLLKIGFEKIDGLRGLRPGLNWHYAVVKNKVKNCWEVYYEERIGWGRVLLGKFKYKHQLKKLIPGKYFE